MERMTIDLHMHSAVSDGTDSYTLTASVMTYARAAVLQGSDTMQTLAKALYLYNQAAKNHLGDEE